MNDQNKAPQPEEETGQQPEEEADPQLKEETEQQPEEEAGPQLKEEKGSYFVYGMAVGLIIGIVMLYVFKSKLAMTVCVAAGMIIGSFIKRK